MKYVISNFTFAIDNLNLCHLLLAISPSQLVNENQRFEWIIYNWQLEISDSKSKLSLLTKASLIQSTEITQ